MGEEFDLEVTPKAFLLRPDIPEGGIERPVRPGESPDELSPAVRRAADGAGLVRMRRPKRTPNSLKVLQAIHHAKLVEPALGTRVRDGFYTAYWEEGLDIGQPEHMRTVVQCAGLEWASVERALAGDAHLDAVLGEFQEGLDLGFQGIPAFDIGGMRFTGAQPLAIFRRIAQQVSGSGGRSLGLL